MFLFLFIYQIKFIIYASPHLPSTIQRCCGGVRKEKKIRYEHLGLNRPRLGTI